MKLNIKASSETGKVKSVSGNTRIDVAVNWRNEKIGTLSLFNILDDKVEGYNVVWDNGSGWSEDQTIEHHEQGKKQQGERCPFCNVVLPDLDHIGGGCPSK